MKTYIEILHSADGEKVSVIFEKMRGMGFEPALGDMSLYIIGRKMLRFQRLSNF
jgi:hypothetical protein